jgi:hypothetical protein
MGVLQETVIQADVCQECVFMLLFTQILKGVMVYVPVLYASTMVM